eukprot:maker-scaffold_8-snap-gene-0.29-mRNA-1 protein AED:0.03 eAED:0.03 QI:410/0.85/0.87/1/0.71/0.62/8/118/478
MRYQFANGLLPEMSKEIQMQSTILAQQTKQQVRNMMLFAYKNYEKRAFGRDELQPISGKANDVWHGHGVTLIDSMDTLWIMDLKEEFYRAKDWVEHNLRYEQNIQISFFETTIRDLGGLLSAYYLSGEKIFLDRAVELGNKLLIAFDDHVFPYGLVNFAKKKTVPIAWARKKALLADIGTFQLEFRALSNLSGDQTFANKAVNAIEFLETRVYNLDGLFPMFIDARTGSTDRKEFSLGPVGDSFYEYLIKVFVQGGHDKDKFLKWYRKSAKGIIKHLLHTSQPTGLRYIRDLEINVGYHDKISHLFCFAPGMFALASHYNTDDPEMKEQDLLVAKQLMYTCYQFYARAPSGLSPEYIHINQAIKKENELYIKPGDEDYNLRPEVVESLYILYYVTKNPIYRVWGKNILDSIEKHAKTTYGYGSVRGVSQGKTTILDKMESFFLAETLKYLYLLFDDNPVVNLDEWVFNTEAHPLKRFD